MAIVYRSKRCPHCGHGLAYGDDAKPRWIYGSPIRWCPFCHNEYLDKNYHEIAIDGVPNNATKRITFFDTIRFILGLCVLGILCYFVFNLLVNLKTVKFSFLLFMVFIGLGGWCYQLLESPLYRFFKYQEMIDSIEKEKQASEKRMQDPEYVQKLIANKYRVPEKYLPQPTKRTGPTGVPQSWASSNNVRTNIGNEKKYCFKCGKPISANSLYCSYCGQKLS